LNQFISKIKNSIKKWLEYWPENIGDKFDTLQELISCDKIYSRLHETN